jgi:cell division protein FtsB
VAQLQAQNTALTATVRVFEQHISNLQLRIAKLSVRPLARPRRRSSARSSNWNWSLKIC